MREIIDPKLVDWSDCPLVERNPLKLSGVPIVVHTRVQADSIVDNYDSGSPVEEIAYNFSIAEDVIEKLLAYADTHRAQTCRGVDQSSLRSFTIRSNS
jgi:uncharacterized protein (DUF433 family)